jgi:hypothetical protein
MERGFGIGLAEKGFGIARQMKLIGFWGWISFAPIFLMGDGGFTGPPISLIVCKR